MPRKRLILFLSVFCLTFCTPECWAQSSANNLWTRQAGEDWPRMLGPNYDSISSETGIRTDWGKSGLQIVWTQKTGEGYGNGVAALGRWLQFDRFRSQERLTCYEAETGRELWRSENPVVYADAYGYNNGPRCSPVVDEDRVYTYGVAGRLACVGLSDGQLRWDLDINEQYNVIQNFFGVAASPLVYGDLVWVMVGGSPDEQRGLTMNNLPRAKPNGTAMVAFDKLTGEERFRVGNYLASYSAPVIRKIDNRDIGLAFVREGLLSFDPKTGTELGFTTWRASSLESVNGASPVVVGSNVLIGEAYEIGGALVNVSESGHKSIWKDGTRRREQMFRPHWTNPIVMGNRIFVSSGRNEPDTDLRCIEFGASESDPSKNDSNRKSTPESTTKLIWSVANRDRMTGIAIDGHIVWLGEYGILQLAKIDGDRYQVVSEMDLGNTKSPQENAPLIIAPSWAPPVISHGLLYVRGANRVVCLELVPDSK
jgi:outer membrane protein assembly factor BamB